MKRVTPRRVAIVPVNEPVVTQKAFQQAKEGEEYFTGLGDVIKRLEARHGKNKGPDKQDKELLAKLAKNIQVAKKRSDELQETIVQIVEKSQIKKKRGKAAPCPPGMVRKLVCVPKVDKPKKPKKPRQSRKKTKCEQAMDEGRLHHNEKGKAYYVTETGRKVYCPKYHLE